MAIKFSNSKKQIINCYVKNNEFGKTLSTMIRINMAKLLRSVPFEGLAKNYFISDTGVVYYELFAGTLPTMLKYVELSYVRQHNRGQLGVWLKYKHGKSQLHYISELLACSFYGIKSLPYRIKFKDGNKENLVKYNIEWWIDYSLPLFDVLTDDQWNRVSNIVETLSKKEYLKVKKLIYSSHTMDEGITEVIRKYPERVSA